MTIFSESELIIASGAFEQLDAVCEEMLVEREIAAVYLKLVRSSLRHRENLLMLTTNNL